MKRRIEEKLLKEFQPESLEVINKSHLHSGHLGSDDSGETHFEVVITAKELNKAGRIQAHRKINSALKEEFLSGVHALEIKIKA